MTLGSRWGLDSEKMRESSSSHLLPQAVASTFQTRLIQGQVSLKPLMSNVEAGWRKDDFLLYSFRFISILPHWTFVILLMPVNPIHNPSWNFLIYVALLKWNCCLLIASLIQLFLFIIYTQFKLPPPLFFYCHYCSQLWLLKTSN